MAELMPLPPVRIPREPRVHCPSDSEGSSSPRSISSSSSNSDEIVDIIRIGQSFSYTIPSFSVITVELRQAVICVGEKKVVKHIDIFLRETQDITVRVPSSIKVLESCYVKISEFAQAIDIQGLSTGSPETVCVIWKWNWLVPEVASVSDDENVKSVLALDDLFAVDSDPEEDARITTQSLVFKCIGTTKCKKYQEALQVVRNLMSEGQTVPVRLI
uniref:Uncharacterized protein n=1 Tax=Amphimedon queenslandica TaxID=400682 RepID=A0A1X7STU9_AMPQE